MTDRLCLIGERGEEEDRGRMERTAAEGESMWKSSIAFTTKRRADKHRAELAALTDHVDGIAAAMWAEMTRVCSKTIE